jgi:glyoxylase-like metal-dependent hydrolase (beta-lactamase superfamily II)
MRHRNRRVVTLSLLLALGISTVAVAAFQAAGTQGRARGAGTQDIQVEKLKDNLFLLRGGGGNTAVFIGADGVTVVDTKIPGWGQPLIAAIKAITPKPVVRVINTHTHYDHVGGNVDFPTTIEFVAHVNTRANMEKALPPKGAESRVPPDVFKANGGKNMSNRTFKDKMTIGRGAEQIDLYYFGRGHTNGDAWVVFPALRIMHAGDIFSGKLVPLLDSNNGGSGVEIADTLAKAATLTDVDSIITGHSTVMTPADLREYSDFNRSFLEYVRAAKKAGTSVDDAAKAYKFPEKYATYRAPQPDSVKNNIEVIYAELK